MEYYIYLETKYLHTHIIFCSLHRFVLVFVLRWWRRYWYGFAHWEPCFCGFINLTKDWDVARVSQSLRVGVILEAGEERHLPEWLDERALPLALYLWRSGRGAVASAVAHGLPYKTNSLTGPVTLSFWGDDGIKSLTLLINNKQWTSDQGTALTYSVYLKQI